ncbi:MAG: hypothetical protein KatS3mg114_0739 [Planctomycetaceae bacterium]|nr:MAG: hypothetical protein KatS3mg114_0739 [Planctomycetaceae bacterium]
MSTSPAKQISIFLPREDWLKLRAEAARRGQPITAVCRRWLQPHLARLPKVSHEEAETSRLHDETQRRRLNSF